MTRRTFLSRGARRAAAAALAVYAGRGGAPARPPAGGWPDHYDPDGGFRNPWPTAERQQGSFLRWQWDRMTGSLPPNPEPHQLPVATPRVARPAAPPGELRATWIGHSTYLVQAGGLNILTDPQLSRRASPVQFMGPARFVPPALDLDALPPIDVVLLSHDHYDHLDDRSVRGLNERFGERIRWCAPLGYVDWLEARGARRVHELDWWGETGVPASDGTVRITALPAQHWTSRVPGRRNNRLWASWGVRLPDGRGVFFCGDTGWFPGHPEIAGRAGPFDLVILPIGAYDPRWFMKPVHVNPEEAVRIYRELGGRGVFAAAHWGTFRLTDEDPLEPPVRVGAAWRDAGLPEEDLWVAAFGESRVV